MKRKLEETSDLDFTKVMEILATLGSEQTKKTYMNHGAREPLFGITTKDLKPLSKKIKRNHELAMELYETGNYDVMYFAGMIADPLRMSQADFEHWMTLAYCHGLSDYVVSVTLAEAPFAQEVADRWIAREQELYQSAGWSCYSWLVGILPDEEFDISKLRKMLDDIEKNIHRKENRVRYSMNGFLIACGISIVELHEEAMHCARMIDKVSVDMGNTSCHTPHALTYIEKAVKSGRIGFKRRNVRC